MPHGTIRWYDKEKGFGFIIPDDGGKDVFVQSSNIETANHNLDDFQRVEYETAISRKGPEAIRVRPL